MEDRDAIGIRLGQSVSERDTAAIGDCYGDVAEVLFGARQIGYGAAAAPYDLGRHELAVMAEAPARLRKLSERSIGEGDGHITRGREALHPAARLRIAGSSVERLTVGIGRH